MTVVFHTSEEVPRRVEGALTRWGLLGAVGGLLLLVVVTGADALSRGDGYDLTRHDWRSFRVDRLSDPRPTGVRFRQRDLPEPHTGDPASFVQAGIRAVPQRHEVSVRVATSATGWSSRGRNGVKNACSRK